MRHFFAFAFAAVVTACMPATSYQSGYQTSSPQAGYAQPAEAQSAATGVYINGQLVTPEQKAELDALLGETVPPGRYALDAQYNFGYEGQPPVVNLAAYARQRQTASSAQPAQDAPSDKPFSMYSQDSAGQGSSLVSDGNGCMIMSTPSGSLSSGC